MTDSSRTNPPQNEWKHWTAEQFSDYMLGLGIDHAASAHLEQCIVCRSELAVFQESMASFNEMSLAWSEQRARQMPSLPVRAQAPFRGWLPAAALAFAAAVAVVVGLPMIQPHAPETSAPIVARASGSGAPAANIQVASVQAPGVQDENSAAAIDRDNRLMMAVAMELDRSEPAPTGFESSSAMTNKKAQSRNE